MTEDSVYALDDQGRLVAWERQSGVEQWAVETDLSEAYNSPLVANGVVYAVGNGGTVVALR